MERSKAFGTALASILLGGGALALAGYALASATPHQGALMCQATTTGNCTLTISSFPDSLAGEHGKSGGAHPNWVSYSNDNLVAPANTTVTMTINQHEWWHGHHFDAERCRYLVHDGHGEQGRRHQRRSHLYAARYSG